MCPLAPVAPPPGPISSFWTDGQICMSLDQIIRGSPIPDDVIDDNPYQYDPSNLPDGSWFLVRSAEKKESKHGCWIASGEACEIFENSTICGWRTTFEFFEVQASIEQKTVWMMQEYKIPQKGEHDQTKSEDSALCRVFSCCNENLNSDMKPENRSDDLALNFLTYLRSVTPHASSNNGERSIGESQVKSQIEGIEASPGNKFRDFPDDDIVAELDCILREDYIELDDLGGISSHSSSSANSRRQSLASDECFDFLELRDLDDELNQASHGNGSTSNYTIMMCRITNDVFMQPAPLESLFEGSGVAAKVTQEVPANKANFTSNPSPDQAVKTLKAEYRNEGSSSSSRATASSSSSDEPGSRREEKRMKKLKKFHCFMPF